MLDPVMHRLLWIYLLINGCDILTTESALYLGGSEANIIAAFLIKYLGHWGLYALKGIIIGLTVIYWSWQAQTAASTVKTILTAQNAIFGIVIAWNSIMILINLLGIKLPKLF